MQNRISYNSCHNAFISDNDGMDRLYPEILNLLKNEQEQNNHISLLYFSGNDPFIFKEQIKVLTTRFPSSVIGYFKDSPKQPYLEIILNTNTKKHIKFYISIKEEWQEEILSQLLYLGVNQTDISFIGQSF
ncbi:hypothetical protein J2X69_004822 [Algoriphagus sp. 4150]|uniref:hypothetical protein n=1 Tax=Algoriphagus sp. 4150 TaxID=2817756 RepID=UPI002864886E|nr:hypothetical protein [Algoriphagus sp. 4150]MDR7132451.1 hypothetical protein [Algoriphagus sp. 4150]